MASCGTGINKTISCINEYISKTVQKTRDSISNAFVYITFTTFKQIYKVKQFFKKNLKDNVKLEHVLIYDHFNMYYYTITHDNKEHSFHYLIPKSLKEDAINKLTNNLIKNTKSNLQMKSDNKKKILHASFVTENDDMLCEITEDLQLFKYYFDTGTKKKDICFWKDVLHIIEKKYDKVIDKSNTYLYIILNDEELTEKTLLLSGILSDHVRF